MNGFNHTPGPWRIVGDEVASGMTQIAEVYRAVNGSANARLIAAAPELLDALQVMLHEFVELPERAHTERGYAAKLARQAIAKVQPRSA